MPQALEVLLVAWALDMWIGEPPASIHPVVWMGKVIAPLRRMRLGSHALELVVGGLYALSVVAGFGLASWALLRALAPFAVAQTLVAVYLLWSSFAVRGLIKAGAGLAAALRGSDLVRARAALGSLCSRNASDLSASELSGAGIESLTENTSDSIVAPLCFFALFGVPGAIMYRAANTLDATVGYRDRYEWLGKVAARLDDVLNLVPARITACLLALAGWVLGLDVARGVRVWWRDRTLTESPNAGHPMAMAAGLLGVRLEKRGAYALGAELSEPNARTVVRTQDLVRITGFFTLGLIAFWIAAWEGKHVLAF